MDFILRSDKGRIAFLNTGLFLLFASAFVSDQWPQLAAVALSLGLIVVLAEAVLLYRFAKRMRIAAVAASAHSVEVAERERDQGLFNLDTKTSILEVEFFENKALRRQYYHSRIMRHRLMQVRPRASIASTWALEMMHDQHQYGIAAEMEFLFAQLKEVPQLSSELASWTVSHYGNEAFNVQAGAFEIEHFHGRTNIRVLDPSRVTVESDARGSRSKAATDDICAPVYQ